MVRQWAEHLVVLDEINTGRTALDGRLPVERFGIHIANACNAFSKAGLLSQIQLHQRVLRSPRDQPHFPLIAISPNRVFSVN